jgi:spermidine synthase
VLTGPAGALALMLASGVAALGAQLVWSQQAALWLGHDGLGTLAVVAGFFGGMALGALLLAPRIERSAVALRGYAACEAMIGVWGLALAFGMPAAGRGLLWLIGPEATALRHGAVAFGGVFLLLLPATAAMGATLPAMARITQALPSRGVGVAGLYAANTAGALLGVVAVLAGVLPSFGFRITAAVCALLNLLCAGLAWQLVAPTGSASAVLPPAAPALTPGGGALLAMLAATGLLGIGDEVLVLRVLSQVTENTVYTFAALLAVYLLFTALGAALHAAFAPVPTRPRWRVALLLSLAVATLSSGGLLWGAEAQRDAVGSALGGGLTGSVLAEASLAVSALALPALLMGALFSQLVSEARQVGVSLGRALGVNTAAAALAPFLVGVWAVPAVGAKLALLALAGGYAALAATQRGGRLGAVALVPALAAVAWLAPPLVFIDVPEGGRVVLHLEGPLAAVSVVEDAAGAELLRINNRQQEGSSVTVPADARQALLPLLLHPSPRHALFVGLGTGITAGAATFDPALDVEAVELLPEVVQSSALFVGALGAAADPARLHVHVADARRFMRTSSQRYDVIVADNFHPARSGSGSLYTVEHFQAVRERLSEGGLFCQWLPLHQLDLATLRSIVQSYLAAFPQARAVLATNSLSTPVIGLVSHRRGEAFAARSGAGFTVPARDFGLPDDLSVFGSFIAGPASLSRFAQGAPWNSDDRPAVAWMAPRATYGDMPAPAVRFLTLLDAWQVAPGEIIASQADTPADAPSRAKAESRLAAYLKARRRFLAAGLAVHADTDPGRMLAQVREPLLAVLRISPDFAPAREPLLRLAEALQRRDPEASAAVERDLQALSATP